LGGDNMPKMLCECGKEIKLHAIPNEYTYMYISEVDYDKYQGRINAEELYRAMDYFIKCPKCSRIWLYKSGNKTPIEYVLTKK